MTDSQTALVHWTVLDPEATDEELLRIDKEGYVQVSLERAGDAAYAEVLKTMLKHGGPFYANEVEALNAAIAALQKGPGHD